MTASRGVPESTGANEGAKDPRTIVRNWWAALEQGKVELLADFLADDGVMEGMQLGHLMPHGGVYTGKEMAIRELLSLIPTHFYQPHRTRLDITAMYRDGNTIITEFTVNAVTARGRPYENVKYVSIIQVENGKIKSSREYPDSLKAKTVHLD